MARIRSKKLYRYLKSHGALNNPREMKHLKREYRRIYQNQWQCQRRKNQKEIRFVLTKEQYEEVRSFGRQQGTTPTQMAKALLLSEGKGAAFIPKRNELLSIAKDLGLAINTLSKEGETDTLLQRLLRAEEQLLDYLKP